ncbi:MAG: hypothetical protein Tsb0015_07850 [Simkaniaceae bacterium]
MTTAADSISLLDQKNWIVEHYKTVQVQIPSCPLADSSLQITAQTPFQDWTAEEHEASYYMLQKTIEIWQEQKFAKQYVVYGKERSKEAFQWEIIPFQTTSNCFSWFWQQFKVLYRISFGSRELSDKEKQAQLNNYIHRFILHPNRRKKESKEEAGTDSFCKQNVIEKQWILEGRKINVLYNYAPIGFGGERLHFLFVPKFHREKFHEVTLEEYAEITEAAKQILNHFSQNRALKGSHLFHKTGKDAGQTVKHWHLHMILTSNDAQDFFGKLTVLKNMLIGSSKMTDEALQKKVEDLRGELKDLQKKII